MVSVFSVTAYAAGCKVVAVVFTNKYTGECVNGFAHGKGTYIASTDDKYEGDFLHGKYSGSGVLTRGDGSTHTGKFLNSNMNGFGIFRTPKSSVPSYQDQKEGAWVGEVFVVTGYFRNGEFLFPCSSDADCKKVLAKRKPQERREAADRTPNVCNSIYPGKTGTRAGPSSLSIDVNYVVRYVNKDRGTATIEATNSGQLNMNRGEMKEVSCVEL